jgi:SH3 domain-containing YSC84-like protein 1
MSRRLIAPLALALTMAALVLAGGRGAGAASETQELVVKARLTVEKLLSDPDLPALRRWIKRAKGVLIVPSLLKAGFLIGAEGGNGVLLARDDKKGWSYPAFYTLAAGSFGLQIGVQDSEVMFIVMRQSGLVAMLDRNVKLGADASVAVGPKGAGVEGATGLAFNADIYSFAYTKGLFGGVSFEGAVAAERKDMNEEFYGKPVSARDIVIGRKVSNAAADALRRALALQ